MGLLYSHLGLDARVQIEKGLDVGLPVAVIARNVGCDRSTVYREIKRNRWRPSNTSAAYSRYRGPGLRFDEVTKVQYRASVGQVMADKRALGSHRRRKLRSDVVVGWVCDRVRVDGWSPAQVAALSRERFKDDPGWWMCPETLYAWIYAPAQAHLRLKEYLVRGHKKRVVRGGRRVRKSRIDRRVSIHDRSQSVEDRTVFGHWEGDSIVTARGGAGGIHTEVERKTRFLQARLVDDLSAPQATQAQLAIFTDLPALARLSTTLDNGSENHHHYQLIDQLGMKTYFADPYSSWQRGSNEHFNGIIRRWLPKGTDFSTITQDELNWITNLINNRPLKTLNWKTPQQAFQEQLQKCRTSD